MFIFLATSNLDLLFMRQDELGREMEHTNGTGEMSPDVAKLLPPSTFKGKPDKKKVPLFCYLQSTTLIELFVNYRRSSHGFSPKPCVFEN